MKNKRKRGFWGTLGCFVGFHQWKWRFEPGSTLVLNAPPPDHARCARCGALYGKKPNAVNHQQEKF